MQTQNKEDLKSKAKKKLSEWRQTIDELNVQMHLGAEEAKLEFEKQKHNLKIWAQETKGKLSDLSDFAEGKKDKLKGSLESLRVQAALAKAEGKEALADQSKKLSSLLNEVQEELKDVYDEGKEDLKEFSEDAREKAFDLRTRFDMFKVQLNLARKEAGDAWDVRKKEMSAQLNELKGMVDEGSDKAQEKWEEIKDDMVKGWKKLRDSLN